jgi:tRNA U34 2-thiouridine synthase MnmA/TrmU
VRKESKTSSKALLAKTGKTLRARPNIPTLNLAAGDGDDITQPVGIEYTIDKAVGLTIGKTNLNTTYKTIGAKTALAAGQVQIRPSLILNPSI